MEPGQLVIVAARPSMGKTALMMNVACKLVLRSDPCAAAIFSFENVDADKVMKIRPKNAPLVAKLHVEGVDTS